MLLLRFAAVLLLTVLLPILAPAACACDTPVYMYSLQTWPADDYEVSVFHRGEESAMAVLALLREAASGHANLVVRETDYSQPPDSSETRHVQPQSESLPWMVVRYPVREGERREVWAGPLSMEAALAWLDSPARRDIAKQLLEGRAGVWILLEGGNSSRDDAAYELLTHELARLERTIPPPPNMPPGPKGISFFAKRVSRKDPAERELVAMLAASEPDLRERSGEPMVFPVFGRGLILYSLVGAGINVDTITEAAEFLAGECSCEIKSQNPGLDLLMAVDWEGNGTAGGGMADFLDRAKKADALLAEADASAAQPEAVEQVSQAQAPVSRRWIFAGVALGIVLLLVIWRVGSGRAGRDDK